MIDLELVTPDPGKLARALHIKVGPEDANPFDLEVCNEPQELGVSAADAERALKVFLRDTAPGFAFRHIPFKTITFGLHDDVYREAVSKNCIVGAGVDPISMPMSAQENHRHVVRLLRTRDGCLVIRDDSNVELGEIEVSWETLTTAVRAVSGGYWLLGKANALGLGLCLPWTP